MTSNVSVSAATHIIYFKKSGNTRVCQMMGGTGKVLMKIIYLLVNQTLTRFS